MIANFATVLLLLSSSASVLGAPTPINDLGTGLVKRDWAADKDKMKTMLDSTGESLKDMLLAVNKNDDKEVRNQWMQGMIKVNDAFSGINLFCFHRHTDNIKWGIAEGADYIESDHTIKMGLNEWAYLCVAFPQGTDATITNSGDHGYLNWGISGVFDSEDDGNTAHFH